MEYTKVNQLKPESDKDLVMLVNDSEPAVSLTIEKGIATISLNRPDSGNSINKEFLDGFDEATLICSERPDIRAVVIVAKGPHFCVGGDINPMIEKRKNDSLASYIRKSNAQVQGALARLYRMAAPSIVAVHGAAAGGGVSLVASADIVVASEKSRFVCAYPSIGYCCDMGGSSVLTERMGVARTRRFYLMHEDLNAAEAKDAGLVDYVVADGALTSKVQEIAEKWANGPTQAYAEVRRLMRSAQQVPYETQMELETQSLAGLTKTQDAGEGINAFMEKRKPHYLGH